MMTNHLRIGSELRNYLVTRNSGTFELIKPMRGSNDYDDVKIATSLVGSELSQMKIPKDPEAFFMLDEKHTAKKGFVKIRYKSFSFIVFNPYLAPKQIL